MKHKLDYQTVFLQGYLVGEIVNNEGEIENVSFMVKTDEIIMGNTISQIHNVTATNENATLIKSCIEGTLLRINARLLWLGEEEFWDEDDIDTSNDVVTYKYLDLLVDSMSMVTETNKVTYNEVFIQGRLAKDAEYSASMEGANTNIVIHTEDNFFGEVVSNSNNLLAINKYALAHKDLKKGQLVEAIVKLLWLDGKDNSQEYQPERLCELIVEVINPLQTSAKNKHSENVKELIASFIRSDNQDELDNKVKKVLLLSSIEKSTKGITKRIDSEVNQK